MNLLIDNWYIVIGVVTLLIAVGVAIYKFAGLPTKLQIAKIKEWLLYAVIEAEKQLGSKTGALKLRTVFDMFVVRFPLVAKMISFETFSAWVDEALDRMKDLLKENEAIKNIVEGVI